MIFLPSLELRHEQSRTDRDSYLQVLWENVPAQFKEAFAKYGKDKIDSLGKKNYLKFHNFHFSYHNYFLALHEF